MSTNRKLSIWLLILLITMASCVNKIQVDLLVYNGVIYTADDVLSMASAFAVSEGKIVEVGDQSLLKKKYQAKETIDLKGLPVFPGFIDAHCHFYGYGLMEETKIDLTGCSSADEMVQRIKSFHEKHPASFIEGRGWDQNLWPSKSFPHKEILDSVFPDIPVFLTRIDGHAMFINSKAIELAGIKPETRIEGGHIMHIDGELSGILIDNAMNLVKDILPSPDQGLIRRALMRAQEDCFKYGLTMVADAGLKYATVEIIDSLQQAGSLKMRIYAMIEPDKASLATLLAKGITDKEKLIVRSIKLYADGALGSRGALLLNPYHDAPQSNGLAMMPWEEIKSYASIAYENDLQLNIHAIGDSAVRSVLKIYAEILPQGNDLRWRIEHAQVVHPDDINMFGMFNIIPSIQATHATSDMTWAGGRLGDRLPTAYAYHDLLSQNGWLPNGTDFPIEGIDPIHTFYASVFRKDAHGKPVQGFQTENALSRNEALLSITRWAAKACFSETRNGSISPGKCADFVVLNQDIMQIEESEILKAHVVATYLDGKAVYQQ